MQFGLRSIKTNSGHSSISFSIRGRTIDVLGDQCIIKILGDNFTIWVCSCSRTIRIDNRLWLWLGFRLHHYWWYWLRLILHWLRLILHWFCLVLGWLRLVLGWFRLVLRWFRLVDWCDWFDWLWNFLGFHIGIAIHVVKHWLDFVSVGSSVVYASTALAAAILRAKVEDAIQLSPWTSRAHRFSFTKSSESVGLCIPTHSGKLNLVILLLLHEKELCALIYVQIKLTVLWNRTIVCTDWSLNLS